MEGFQFLESAASGLRKDINALQKSNTQAEIEKNQNIDVIERLTEALDIAHSFQEAQELYIDSLESLA
ncbi:9811_t:CDS:1, partial [Acaulospora colombiana]